MAYGLEIIGLVAAGTFAATLGIAARLGGRSPVPAPVAATATKPAPRLAVAQERAAPKRIVVPEKIAILVVEYLRAEGHNEYPFIVEDLDLEIMHVCDAFGIERVSAQRVRELIALLPGVYRPRPRLNMHDPKHRYVRNRMIAHGRAVGEKVTYYEILDTPAECPATPLGTPQTEVATPTVRPDTPIVRPTSGRPRGRTVRTGDHGSAQSKPKVRPDVQWGAAA